MISKKVLVVPLNWGLGHTTRLIPVISMLQSLGAAIYFGGSKAQIALMKHEFKSIRYIPFPTIRIRLGKQKYQVMSFFLQLPVFALQILREHLFLNKLIKRKGINVVISDNVYGLWNNNAYTIFITHQLEILLPGGLKWIQNPVNQFIRRNISKFNECWIPDVNGTINFAGKLSHPKKLPVNCKYIGILSRFDRQEPKTNNTGTEHDLLILLSGPEPQRSQFERMIAKQLSQYAELEKYIVVRGIPYGRDTLSKKWINHLPAQKLYKLIMASEYIICRSGYSTIMDLIALNKRALLVPTPGQKEQEYLASYMQEKNWFDTMDQEHFNLRNAFLLLKNSSLQNNFTDLQEADLLKKSLQKIMCS